MAKKVSLDKHIEKLTIKDKMKKWSITASQKLNLANLLSIREMLTIPSSIEGNRGISELNAYLGIFCDRGAEIMDSPKERAIEMKYNNKYYHVEIPKRLKEGEVYAEIRIRRIK